MIRALALCLLPGAAMSAPLVESLAPPPAAYFPGDELVQELRLTLPPGVSPDPASLPLPGPKDYWLDLRSLRQERRGDQFILFLHWQTFYSAVTADRREVPGLSLRLSDGSLVQAPGFSFIAAPLIPLTDDMSAAQMRPDPPVHTAPGRRIAVLFVAALAAFALSVLGLARHHGTWPFHQRGKRPFTRAARQLRNRSGRGPAEARRLLHRAFDEAAGRVVLSADLAEFLAARPEFQRLSTEISEFFLASDRQFFGVEPAGPPAPEFVSRLSRAERGLL